MAQEKSTLSHFLTPAGAFIAILAFFLPWVRMSCAGQMYKATGFQMAKSDNLYWVVFAGAVLILLAYFYLRSRWDLGKVKKIVVGSALAGLGILLYKYFDFKSSMDSLENFSGTQGFQGLQSQAGAQDLQFTLQIGAYACLAGFVLAGLGVLFMREPEIPRVVIDSERSSVSRRTTAASSATPSSFNKPQSTDCNFCVNGLPAGFVSCPECGAQKPTVVR